MTVEFDDAAVADFFDDQVDRGRRPEQFARLWLHTHPGNSPEPSGTDEDLWHQPWELDLERGQQPLALEETP